MAHYHDQRDAQIDDGEFKTANGRVAQAVAGVLGGGSPLMETITMMSRYDLEPLKNLAKYLAGFPGVKCPRIERESVTPRAMLDKFKKTQLNPPEEKK